MVGERSWEERDAELRRNAVVIDDDEDKEGDEKEEKGVGTTAATVAAAAALIDPECRLCGDELSEGGRCPRCDESEPKDREASAGNAAGKRKAAAEAVVKQERAQAAPSDGGEAVGASGEAAETPEASWAEALRLADVRSAGESVLSEAAESSDEESLPLGVRLLGRCSTKRRTVIDDDTSTDEDD